MAQCERQYDPYDDPCGSCSACRANETYEIQRKLERRADEEGDQLTRIEEKLDRLLELLEKE